MDGERDDVKTVTENVSSMRKNRDGAYYKLTYHGDMLRLYIDKERHQNFFNALKKLDQMSLSADVSADKFGDAWGECLYYCREAIELELESIVNIHK